MGSASEKGVLKLVRAEDESKAGGDMVDEERFKSVMGRLAAGVTIVTATGPDGLPVGFTASSVSSVSLQPPLVLVCLDRASKSHDPVLASGAFAVNFLTARQEDVARRFASEEREGRFDGLDVVSGPSGSPVLEGVLGWLDCRIWKVYDGGDHSIVVGEVLGCAVRGGNPLVYFDRRYRRLGS